MKVFSIHLKESSILFFLFMIVGGILFSWHSQEQAITTMLPTTSKTIVIDAGHGGWDPGRTGVNGENEKNINLKIALKLQTYLEQGGATVLITRNEDSALSQKKKEDMKQRKEIANESEGDILISIHQNSFPKKSAKGAQVFYYNNSEESKKLAEYIQNSLKQFLDPNNERLAKANTSYYILKNTKLPAAIVECGFLTNAEEEAMLNDEKYQEKVAWAIYLGILDYFGKENEAAKT